MPKPHAWSALALMGAALMAQTDGSAAADATRLSALKAVMAKVRPLHRKLGKPQPGDWLAVRRERGQTFAQYIESRPARSVGKRRVLYVQPLGAFTESQRRIVELSADFMGRYFGLAVKIRENLPLSIVPERARRRHPTWGVEQILSTYVLDDVLKPRLPPDAAAYLAFTSSDLWPGRGWNFVFGQASLRDRVGVWSIHRNGDPDASPASFRLCLLRTMKTATHETGHMFSMWHCTKYECNMCGCNNRQEGDRRPIALCPECLAKVCWATGADPVRRFQRLSAFCDKQGLVAERAFYEKSLRALGSPRTGQPSKSGHLRKPGNRAPTLRGAR